MTGVCRKCKYFDRENACCSEAPTCQKDIDDAYQQGREDAIKEYIMRDCESCKEHIKADGRTKAIDELVESLLTHKKLTREIDTNDIYESIKIEFITDIAKKIGEKNE